MTSFTDEEEDQTEAGLLGMAWLLDVALKNAGAVFDDGSVGVDSHVVVDRNLITGQNPGSTEATADAVIKKLAAGPPGRADRSRDRRVRSTGMTSQCSQGPHADRAGVP